jgi:hypothetical protein
MSKAKPPRPTPMHPAVSAALKGGLVPIDPTVLDELNATDRELVRVMTRLRKRRRRTTEPRVHKVMNR